MDKKREVAKAEELADWIIVNSNYDDVIANDVREKLQLIKRPVEEAWMKLEVRQNCIKDALLHAQTTEDSADDVVDRISELEERLNKEKPVSATLSVVKEQKNNHEVSIGTVVICSYCPLLYLPCYEAAS